MDTSEFFIFILEYVAKSEYSWIANWAAIVVLVSTTIYIFFNIYYSVPITKFKKDLTKIFNFGKAKLKDVNSSPYDEKLLNNKYFVYFSVGYFYTITFFSILYSIVFFLIGFEVGTNIDLLWYKQLIAIFIGFIFLFISRLFKVQGDKELHKYRTNKIQRYTQPNRSNARTQSLIGLSSSNELRIALHYKDAASILYKSDAYQDAIALPFLFLIRQFLELGLKYNIKQLSKVSNCNDLLAKLNGTHDLETIYQAFLTHYRGAKKELGVSKIKEQKYLDALEKLVKKIIPLDHDSQGFRYAINKKGQKIIAQDETFNLKEVFDLLEDTSTILMATEDILGLDQSA
ncbi:hypothetical protein [Thiomicrorhabdus xiamenensis]|uniref:Uncharacterized protein n=1 Tax=Thiomicrorhabdus xiamenensis TaxID=2739063 RepID=A0A7D4NQJ5_9GAMM|nr:hypothetical protein [Thiomicrorhabdus xiamenensis]QKI88730.1 hypothetical protein HQN79_03690 [Thiomicrorhabdus xiamenensis]